MPTEKPRLGVIFTEQELHRLDALRVRLQSPSMKGTPQALSRRVSLNRFVAQLALWQADQIEADPQHGTSRPK